MSDDLKGGAGRHEAFFEALVHSREHVVMGRRLRPLTLWHWLWLDALGSPVLEGRPASLLDLTLAVAVCGADFEELPGAVLNKSLRRRLWFGLGWTFRWKLEVEAAKFTAYFSDYFTGPDLWQDEDEDERTREDASLPGYYRTVARLMQSGLSRKEAWMMPVGEAQFLSVVWQESAGAEVKWVTPKERQMMDEAEALKAMMAEMREQGGGLTGGAEYGTQQSESEYGGGPFEGGTEGGGGGRGCGPGGDAGHGAGDGDGGEQGADSSDGAA